MSTIVTGHRLLIASPSDNISPAPSGSPQLYFDGTNTITTTAYSVPLYVDNKDVLGVQLSCPSTGSPAGSFIIQGSNDAGKLETQRVPDASLTNWATLSFWDESEGLWVQSHTVAGATSIIATVRCLSCRWVRVKWTNTSGSALLTMRYQLRADGGR